MPARFRVSRECPSQHELLGRRRLTSHFYWSLKVIPNAFAGDEQEQQRQNAAADGQNSPEKSLHLGGHLRRVNGGGGRNVVLAPDSDGSIIETVDFPPAGKSEQRFVVSVAHENPLQSVAVGVVK